MTKPKITKKNNTKGQKQPKTTNGLPGVVCFLIVFPCLIFLVLFIALAIGFSNRPTTPNSGVNYSQETIKPEISEFEKYLHNKYGNDETFTYVGSKYSITNLTLKEGMYAYKFTSKRLGEDEYFLVNCTVKDGIASFSDDYEAKLNN